MKKLFCIACTLSLLLMTAAYASLLEIPNDAQEIESESFKGVGAFDSVYFPEGLLSIADDAFDERLFTVYGHPGSEGEAFSNRMGRRFVSVAIEDVLLLSSPWTSPDAPYTFTASAESVISPMLYSIEASKDGVVVYQSESAEEPAFQTAFSESGVYDVAVEVSHKWDREKVLFKNALTVAEHVKLNEDSLKVGIGRTKTLIADSEKRSVTLSSGSPVILSVSGKSITGEAKGFSTVTAVARQPEGEVVTKCEIEVYIPVEEIRVENAPAHVFVGKSAHLQLVTLPENADYPAVTYTSLNPEIISIDESGCITALASGKAEILIESDGISKKLNLTSSIGVDAIEITTDSDGSLYSGLSCKFEAVCLPENAENKGFAWSVSDENIAEITEDGVLYAKASGEAEVIATALDGSGTTASFPIRVIGCAERISLKSAKNYMQPGESMHIQAQIYPEDAEDQKVYYTSDRPETAIVNENGLVTALKTGVVTISAEANNGVRSAITLHVINETLPTSLVIESEDLVLDPGDTVNLTFTCEPGNVDFPLEWYTVSSHTAAIDENGVVSAVNAGSTYVGVRSTVNPNISASIKVTVLNKEKSNVIPLRRTTIEEIDENIARIRAVRTSAETELDNLVLQGLISEEERDERMAVINRAFGLYEFPWMVLEEQEYWLAANSEGGAKDYQPGTVYYGLPYTNWSHNRFNTVESVLEDNRYYLHESGEYYIMNQKNHYYGTYSGSNCSGTVVLCYYGLSEKHRSWTTTVFATTNKFRTLKSFDELRPGDMFVKPDKHAILFLYFVDEAKKKMMIFEQGGFEPAINTVSVNIRNKNHYPVRGYIARRPVGWAR